MRNVGKSVNVKKMSTIWWEQFLFYLNLSKILHFLFFKTKREKLNDKEDVVEFQHWVK